MVEYIPVIFKPELDHGIIISPLRDPSHPNHINTA